jgi:hypothetical protein
VWVNFGFELKLSAPTLKIACTGTGFESLRDYFPFQLLLRTD